MSLASDGDAFLAAIDRAEQLDQRLLLARVEAALFGISDGDRAVCLGRYRLIEVVGTGGSAVIYRAWDPELERDVAIKILPAADHCDRALEQLAREAKTMAQLRDPHLVAVYDVGTYDLEPPHEQTVRSRQVGVYLVMDLIEGHSLRRHLDERHLGWRAIVDLFREAGRGLSALHSRGIVHRDFKPDNVLVERGGRVFLGDFGLAKPDDGTGSGAGPEARIDARALWDTLQAVTQSPAASNIAGTPLYMAPEQHAGEPAVPSSDQFAFCAALWEALCRAPAFAGNTAAELWQAKRDERRRRPHKSVPRWLIVALTRGLNPDPERRYDSMASLLRRLDWRRRVRLRSTAALGLAAAAVLTTAWAREPQPLGADDVERCTQRAAATARKWHETLDTSLGLPEPFIAKGRAFTDAWREHYEETCRPPQQPTPAQVAVRSCLDLAAAQFSAVLRRTDSADEAVLRTAPLLLQGVTAPDRCSGEENPNLDRPPVFRVSGERALEIENLVFEVELLTNVGELDQGLHAAQTAVERARALDEPGLESLAEYWLANALNNAAQREQSNAHRERALVLAERSGYDSRRAWIHIHFARRALNEGDLERARTELERVSAIIDRIGHELELVAEYQWVHAHFLGRSGRPLEALAQIDETIDLLGSAVDEDYHWFLQYRVTRAHILRDLGRYDEAERELRAILAIAQQEIGKWHMVNAEIAEALYATLIAQGELDRAQAELLHIRDQLRSYDHNAAFVIELGYTALQVPLARKDWRQAVTLLEELLGSPDIAQHRAFRCDWFGLLAIIQLEEIGDEARAREVLRSGEQHMRRFGLDRDPKSYWLHLSRAKLDAKARRWSAALEAAQQAAATSHGDPELAGTALLAQAEALAALGRERDAWAALEDATSGCASACGSELADELTAAKLAARGARRITWPKTLP